MTCWFQSAISSRPYPRGGSLSRRLGIARVEPDLPRLDGVDDEMGRAPVVAREDRADDPAVAQRPAEDDVTVRDERVHEGRVLRPAALLLQRLGGIELRPDLAHHDVEHGHGYNSYTNIRGRPGFDVVDPSG